LEDARVTIDLHAKTALYLMESKQWDFLMVVFKETDTLQHIFWRDVDPNHPRYDPERAKVYGTVLIDFYKKIDAIIAQILRKVDRNTAVFLVSDHGFTRFSKYVGLNVFLMDHGYLKLKRNPRVLVKRLMFQFGITPLSLFRLLNKLHLGKFRHTLQNEDVRRKIRRAFISLRDVDWHRTVAYSMGGWGQIYLNVKGREPLGIVPREEAKAITERMIEQLHSLEDPSSGKRIFEGGIIKRREEVYTGPLVSEAPEIVAIPTPPYKTYPDYEFGSNKLVTETVGWSGAHAMNGIFSATGPGIKKGTKPFRPNIVDVAPTILYLLGLPVPQEMDGRVLTEIISEDLLQKAPVTREAVSSLPTQSQYAYRTMDEEDLKNTLKSLGYL